jgi:hypothetical protein
MIWPFDQPLTTGGLLYSANTKWVRIVTAVDQLNSRRVSDSTRTWLITYSSSPLNPTVSETVAESTRMISSLRVTPPLRVSVTDGL